MAITEKNQVRMVGLLPSQDADPIPVRLATEAAGADMIEKNQVRMVGVLPSQGADPIPVSGMLYPSPMAIPPPAFVPRHDTYDWEIVSVWVKNRSALTPQYFYAPVCLPHGVTVSTLTLYGYRDDALAVLSLLLYRLTRVGGAVAMVTITADWTTGYSYKSDSTIANPIIDNGNYQYILALTLEPNDSVEDVKFTGAKIEFSA